MRRYALLILLASVGVMTAANTAAAFQLACVLGGCEPPLSEQADTFRLVFLAKWTGAVEPIGDEPGRTRLTVVACRPVEGPRPKKGESVSVAIYRAARPGDLFLVIGGNPAAEDGVIDAHRVIPATPALFRYLCTLPAERLDRLRYYVRYLESADEAIGTDAYDSLLAVKYEELVALRHELPRQRLRVWLTDPEVYTGRRELYGVMLGLCGDESDAQLLGRIALESTEDFRLGTSGVMSGYLMLTGEDGLRRLEDAKFGRDAGVPFGETYAALQAIRFLWDHGEGRIARERLKESMRLLLDRPEIADLAIRDLARWQDWEVQDRLVRLYGTEGYGEPHVKRAIVRYLIAAANDPARDPDGNLGRHTVDARRQIERLRKIDPKLVKLAELSPLR